MEAFANKVGVAKDTGADGKFAGAGQGVEVEGAVAVCVGGRKGDAEDAVCPFEGYAGDVEFACKWIWRTKT